MPATNFDFSERVEEKINTNGAMPCGHWTVAKDSSASLFSDGLFCFLFYLFPGGSLRIRDLRNDFGGDNAAIVLVKVDHFGICEQLDQVDVAFDPEIFDISDTRYCYVKLSI